MDEPLDNVSVDLRQVLFEIASALDAVGIDDINHGHRVAYIAYQCAKRMGWEEEQAQIAFSLGLIHDCGVSQSNERSYLFKSMAPENTKKHCIKGYGLLSACPPLAGLALPVLYHHTWWEQLSCETRASEIDKLLAGLLFISDRVDYLYSRFYPDQYGNITENNKKSIIGELTANAGILFEPNMVQHMCELIDNDDFWFSMESRYIETMASRFPSVPFFSSRLGLEDTIAVAEFFAQIVDAKSTFTFQHSRHVAELTSFLGKQLGYSTKAQRMLYLAGLVHDIGKLKTPVAVLHKPAELTDEEYACIKRHATDTRHALTNMFRSSQVIDWASNHHERLDGSGYPLGKTAKDLDQPSRIVAIADVFQALTQSRPYRQGVSLEETMQILQELVDESKLDSVVFECLMENDLECYQISTGHPAIEKASA
ncbi:HD-GYP domain-containing protein [Vibrio coralliilyticus]|uniref:HD-GYP domain-containing protein n=1 Tax=Vibrio coralliilyticus TaxID=190893 RepID=UPI001E451858|nr:HD-GYP domain-containing protein [Vibrio coralliilyticus]MCC2521606.1 HD domain-containing protein [Vibrio coralliilyticus]